MAWPASNGFNNNGSLYGSQPNSVGLSNGTNAAAELSRSGTLASQLATPSASAPAAVSAPSLSQSLSQQSVESTGSAHPVFKNPLGKWRSPSPPAKRQKTTPGQAASSFPSASTSASGGFGKSPSSLSPSSAQTWTPRKFSFSQPVPGSSTPTRAARTTTPIRTPVRTPVRTPTSRPGSLAGAAAQRRVSNPAKVRETTENNKTILIIDDSDDEDDSSSSNKGKSAPASTTPVPVPGVPPFPRTNSAPSKQLAKQPETPVPVPAVPAQGSSTWAQSLAPSVSASQPPPSNNGSYIGGFNHNHTPTPPPQVPHTAGARQIGQNGQNGQNAPAKNTPIIPPQFMLHNANYTASQPMNQPSNFSTVKQPPFNDSTARHNLHSVPPTQPPISQPARSSASQPPGQTPSHASVAPITPIPVTTTGTTAYGTPTPTPVPPPAVVPALIPSDVVNPVTHHNGSLGPTKTKAIEEHLEPAVNVDITPTRLGTLTLLPRGTTTTKQDQEHCYFVRYAHLVRRPYLRSSHRRFVAQNYHDLPTLLGMPRQSQRRALTASYPPSPPAVIHIDFLSDEINHLLDVVRFVHANAATGRPSKRAVAGQKHSSAERELKSLLRRQPPEFEQLVVNSVTESRLPGRHQQDIYDFLIDARAGHINNKDGSGGPSGSKALAPALGGPAALTLKRHDRSAYTFQESQATRATKLGSLLMMREVAGQRPIAGRSRQLLNFTNAVRTFREDSLRLRNQWTNLAGDVITISWTSEDAFICGTTTHMDERNHQYNRQGNLALGSVSANTLRAFPDHRIARSKVAITPLTQPPRRPDVHDDPWLYTSVVSSDYNTANGLAFTCGFDKNAFVWKVNEDGSSMTRLGTWHHEGKVNFVVTSSSPSDCLVATAADVPKNAVCVYRVPTPAERAQGNHKITYNKFCFSKNDNQPEGQRNDDDVESQPNNNNPEGQPLHSDKWAYFPATIRWGLSAATRHLLLVGYSPRSLDINADDEDIPEDRRNSGHLCLWDGATKNPNERTWRVLGATSQNVFEVAWHPTQACFVAATAPNMHQANEHNARTQIRIFRLSLNSEYGGRAYSEVQTLDCYTDDINELALCPNSFGFLYVAAGCTNGHTYVWDTSQGDDPVHDLGHDACIEELSGDRISTEDTGVKFVVWGETPDRLYTGSSDGVVKVWNIRTHGVSGLSPFVRDLLKCPAPVSFGTFSPDKSKLAIGDASGRVFLMSVEDGMEDDDEDGGFISEEEEAAKEVKKNQGALHLRGRGLNTRAGLQHNHLAFKRHPPELIQHPANPPPSDTSPAAAPGTSNSSVDEDEFPALARARAFLASGQLVIAPDPTIGAVKGPNYAETNLFCLDAHQDRQPDRPLLAQFDRLQQENRPRASTSPSRQRALRSVYPDVAPAPSFTSFGPSGRSLAVLGAPDPLQSLQRQNAIRRVQMLHETNLSYDLDVNSLPDETREALELADRAALLHIDDNDYDYGYDYEDAPDIM